MTTLKNLLKPDIDIAGSRFQDDTLPKTGEAAQLGEEIQSGINATITAGTNVVVSGLLSMTENSVGKFITFSNSTTTNNGTFQIINFNNPTSVNIEHSAATTESNLDWTEREPYRLQDELNYIRRDRTDIKGVGYDQDIPTYTRCNDLLNDVPANLSNIAGKTTDAKSLVGNKKINNIFVSSGNSFITITSAGQFKHADAIDTTGIPINDGLDFGNDDATFVAILNADGYGTELQVRSGLYIGQRIFGRTRAGSSISPNSIEIEFRSVAPGDDISNSNPYTWESGQPTTINLIIGYRDCLVSIPDNALRILLTAGTLYGGVGGGGGGISLPIDAIDVNVDNSNLVISNGTNVQEVLEDLDGYIAAGGAGLPPPRGVGHFLFSADGVAFRSEQPVVNESEGWILTNNDGVVVVIGT